jgi:hypothetical protein
MPKAPNPAEAPEKIGGVDLELWSAAHDPTIRHDTDELGGAVNALQDELNVLGADGRRAFTVSAGHA